jgi:hypothetical protein
VSHWVRQEDQKSPLWVYLGLVVLFLILLFIRGTVFYFWALEGATK